MIWPLHRGQILPVTGFLAADTADPHVLQNSDAGSVTRAPQCGQVFSWGTGGTEGNREPHFPQKSDAGSVARAPQCGQVFPCGTGGTEGNREPHLLQNSASGSGTGA